LLTDARNRRLNRSAALLYVELNPVRARMMGEATAWEWSSARAHVEERDETGMLAWRSLAEWGGCTDWRERLRQGQARSTEEALRRATRTGKPFADAEFCRALERRFGRDEEWEQETGCSAAKGRLAASGMR
jgi:hypothetical protein